MDLDALREALDSDERLCEMMRDRGLTPPSSPILAAARAVLDSEEAWWCQGTRIVDGRIEGVLPGSLDWQNCFEGRIPRHRDCGWARVVRVRLLAKEGT